MLTANLNNVPLKEGWVDGVPQQHAFFTFAFLGAQENEHTSVVYAELLPGEELGSHTDSFEEILLIFQGRVEVTVGDEKGIVEAPTVALVPTLAPHNLRNVGDEPVRFAGFFPSRYIVSVFDNAWQPDGTNIVDTAQIEQALAAAAE
ncbi:MAG: cupin domain-containing protein [Anaerolineae bacterium]|nr:cupin domain-containing protein [Anaerolineae bacterium]